ncbi:MAG: hypothetical protein QW388_04460 [Thermoplasmatales archaeon]
MELSLDEVGYNENLELKTIDHSCISGTFSVLAIKRINEYAELHFVEKRTLLQKVCNNAKGVDLDHLVIFDSKDNYLIALENLLIYRPSEGIEIPVYPLDSIFVSKKATYTSQPEVCLQYIRRRIRITV